MKRSLAVALLLSMPVIAQEQQQPTFGESVDVVRYLIPARVVDLAGRAIPDLKAEELTASIGGKKAVVESVEWISAAVPQDAAPSDHGRLVVLFVQTDFARNPARVKGQLKFNALIRRVLEMLEPTDLVAVVSQDSHLKLLCDFTLDREVARQAVNDAIEIRNRPLPPAPASGPSLVRHLKQDEMRNAASPGAAMKIVANALRANDGGKLMIFAGWGIGERVNALVRSEDAWREAMAAFRDDDIPVITLGTGLGGDLTTGLIATAKATGGFYSGTQDFSEQSLIRLRGVLSGQYEIVLQVPGELPVGEHAVELTTSRANAKVLVSPLTVVRESQTIVEEIPMPVAATPDVTASRLYIDALQKLRDGNAEEAEALLTRAIGMEKTPEESWYERALLLAARGEMEKATADLRTYLERAPRGKRASEARELLASWQ